MNEFDLLRPVDILILDTSEVAQAIAEKFGEFLQKPDPGFYCHNSLLPSVVPGKTYLTERSSRPVRFENITSVDQLKGIKEALVHEGSGEIVIPEYFMQNARRMITTEPVRPVRAYSLIEATVKQHISEFTKHRMNFINDIFIHNRVFNNLTEAGRFLFDDSVIEDMCEPILTTVSNFLGSDNWNIYFVNRKGLDLYVEKSVDFRIFDWERRNNNDDWDK